MIPGQLDPKRRSPASRYNDAGPLVERLTVGRNAGREKFARSHTVECPGVDVSRNGSRARIRRYGPRTKSKKGVVA